MRYEETRRWRGVTSAWLRLKLWFLAAPKRRGQFKRDPSYLSDHERRDIGLPTPVRYMDWKSLKDNDRF